MFRGSAWEYNEERGQFYLHQFVAGQPDLNYRNPLVVQEMLNVLSFWLDLGVDGFRMDAVAHIWEDGEFKDEPVSYDSDVVRTLKTPKTRGKTRLFWYPNPTSGCAGSK